MKKFTILTAVLLCSVWMVYGQWTYNYLSEPKSAMGYGVLGDSLILAGGYGISGSLNDVEVFDPVTGQGFLTGSNLSVARGNVTGVVCGGKFFCAGGAVSMQAPISTVDVFDVQTQQWSVEQLSQGRFMISAVSAGNKVFFAGGFADWYLNGSDVVDIYDLQTQTWSVENLSEPRGGMAAAVLGDLVVIAGGMIDQITFSDRVDIYNMNTNTWITKALSEPRAFVEVAAVGSKVLIAGGLSAMGVPSEVVDIYDISNNSWSTTSLFTPRCLIKAATLNNKVYFAGGATFSFGWSDYSNIIDIYNEEDDSWSIDVMPVNCLNPAIASIGDYLVIAGGENENGVMDLVQVFYDPPQSNIIHIPGDYPTIQQGIDAATSGDTVLVSDGTYYENINFLGKKPLIVASEFLMDGDTTHISNTIINGSQPVNPDIGSVVTFESGEDTTSVLCGFTITGGTGTMESSEDMRMGGGIHIKYAGGKLLNNYVCDNTVTHSGAVIGGGMQLGGPVSVIPWLVLRGNRIFNNHAVSTSNFVGGGGVICYYNLIMENNNISYNEINGHQFVSGGGMNCYGEFGSIELRISHNTFTHNKAITDNGAYENTGTGGGIRFDVNCWGTINNNIISFNTIQAPGLCRSYGTGVLVDGIYTNSFVFGNNIIEENSTTSQSSWGGGLSLISSGGVYQNNVIRNNSAYYGGGISILDSWSAIAKATLINNTITGNDAYGLHLRASQAVVINSILYNNTPSGTAIYSIQSNLEVRYSDVEGTEVWPGEGNVNCSPAFLEDGYHLDPTSQLLNAGITSVTVNGVVYNCPAWDIDGEPRPFTGTQPEIGVDELQTSEFIGEPVSTNNSQINIFPNPANQILMISAENGTVIKAVNIYDQVGKMVYTGIPENNSLDISKLKPGIYIVEVVTGQGKIRQKLIIQ